MSTSMLLVPSTNKIPTQTRPEYQRNYSANTKLTLKSRVTESLGEAQKQLCCSANQSKNSCTAPNGPTCVQLHMMNFVTVNRSASSSKAFVLVRNETKGKSAFRMATGCWTRKIHCTPSSRLPAAEETRSVSLQNRPDTL
ncbi:hypothetical protein GQ600_12346 [Phytophthora cactorum]|nr:hypothetical protein GQ600_12346 [Phytophthora cactorum]